MSGLPEPVVTRYTAKGSYGDETVPVSFIEKPGSREAEPLLVLLHGVHGCASADHGNKYGDLAHMIVTAGARAAIIETSRSRRDRETFGDDREAWAWAAFDGKTFDMDHSDVLSGLKMVRAHAKGSPLWLWGFSLGGLHAVMAGGADTPVIPELEGLVLSGSGVRIRPEEEKALTLPILSTCRSQEELEAAARSMRTRRLVAFRGDMDETFSQASCRRFVDLAPLDPEAKHFYTIQGADHSFRHRNGQPSRKPLEEMMEILAPLL